MTRSLAKILEWTAICIAVTILTSCSGHRFKRDDNPFINYRIKSVAIPMFVNKSAIPNVHASLTREISLLLSSYTGLRVYPGESDKADAILVGIVSSDRKINRVFRQSGRKFISDEGLIGGRRHFYVPFRTSYSLQLQLVLIRRSTALDLDLIRSKWGPYLKNNSKIVFNEQISLSSSFSRVISDDGGIDGGGPVNFTKTQGVFASSLDSLAETAALKFKQMVLDAF